MPSSCVSRYEQTEQKHHQSVSTVRNAQFTGLRTVEELSEFFRNQENLEEQEEDFSMPAENEEEYIKEIGWVKEAMRNKLTKNILAVKVILLVVLCLLLLNFVLLVVVMSWTSALSSASSSSTAEISKQMNQTQENVESLQQDIENVQEDEKFKFGGIESWINSTAEKIYSLHQKLETLQNDTKINEVESRNKLSGVKKELAGNVSKNLNLLQDLENKTNGMDSDAWEFREKFETPLKNFVYGDFSSAPHFDVEFCGGVFNFSRPLILRYSHPRKNLSSSSPGSCVWLVWSRTVTSIKMRLIYLKGVITVYTNLQTDGRWAVGFSLTSANVFQDKSVSSNIALIVFTPSPSSSSSSTLSAPSEFGIGFQQGPAITGSSVYSLMSNMNGKVRITSNGYGNNERRFYIFYPPPGQKIQLDLESLDTESGADILYTFTYGNTNASSPQNLRLLASHSGTGRLGQLFTGLENQPFVLFLVSNARMTKAGFNVSVSTVVTV